MTYIRLFIIVLLCVSISDITNAQPRRQQTQMQPRVVFFETVLVPMENTEMTRLDVNYRVMKNFFVFTRAASPAGGYEFEGGYELSVEIFDGRGQSRAREIKQETIFSDTPTLEFPDIEYIQGGFSFELPQGEYRFLIRLNDRNSQRRYTDRETRITIPPYAHNEPAVFDILFVEPNTAGDTINFIKPVNLGGGLFFGEPAYGAVLFKTSSENINLPGVTVSIHHLESERKEGRELFSDRIPQENIYSERTIQPDYTKDSLFYNIVETDAKDYYLALFSLQSESFKEGIYRIRVAIDDNEKSAHAAHVFPVHWLDKPASLRNIDFAVEMLEYIVSPEEYRNLRRGSSDERRRKFLEFWEDKNPDPQTAYNPVKTEFYRRVDYAAREFTSLREQNGARTDRGKIYILYGPPTSKDRSLIPGQAPQETWIYTHLNQKFIFVDQSRQGNYRLSTREEL